MRHVLWFAIGLLLAPAALAADSTPVRVMVLGTFHLDNPGQDLNNIRAVDVLTPQRQAGSSMSELLVEANNAHTLADASMYYRLLSLDSGEDQPGAELFGYWTMRNAKIFAKLMDVTRPGDRVVVIFGAGHKHWLEQLVANTPGYAVVDPVPYLNH